MSSHSLRGTHIKSTRLQDGSARTIAAYTSFYGCRTRVSIRTTQIAASTGAGDEKKSSGIIGGGTAAEAEAALAMPPASGGGASAGLW